jgi:hypothetical protein
MPPRTHSEAVMAIAKLEDARLSAIAQDRPFHVLRPQIPIDGAEAVLHILPATRNSRPRVPLV